MKVIVTGGLGFIGCNFIKYILQSHNEEYKILNIDSVTYAANQSLIPEFERFINYDFQKTDITSQKEVRKIFSSFSPDLIINFAAESHVDNSITKSAEFINTNIIGTHILLEESRRYLEKSDKADSFKFIQISTDEVYGSLSIADPSSCENSNYKPNSPYSASKASADHLTSSWFTTYGLPSIITHSSNNFGPYQHKEKLIPKIIDNYINNKKIPIYGDGKNIRDWIFVSDNVKALLSIMKLGEPGEIYNIGGDNELTNLELVSKICDSIKKIYPDKDLATLSDAIEFVEDRPGHDFRYSMNSDKLNKLSNSPYLSNFEDSIVETIKWYVEVE